MTYQLTLELLRQAGSAGRTVVNVETRVVDDNMNDVTAGVVGEIVHRSPQLLTGYFNDAERTNAAFEGGWFHSGDLAVIDDEGDGLRNPERDAGHLGRKSGRGFYSYE